MENEFAVNKMKNTPEKLFLIVGDPSEMETDDFEKLDTEFVLWSEDRQFKNDIEFIPVSKIEELIEVAEIVQDEVSKSEKHSEVIKKAMLHAHGLFLFRLKELLK